MCAKQDNPNGHLNEFEIIIDNINTCYYNINNNINKTMIFLLYKI